MSTLAHHGIIYVPLGYKTTFHLLGDNSEVRGGSAWGAGTFSVSHSLQNPYPEGTQGMLTLRQNGDGSRQPSQKELEVATAQGKAFYEAVAKVSFQ